MMMLAFTVQFSRYGRSLRPGRRVPQLTPRTYLDASGEAVRRDAGPGRVHRRVISRGYPPSVSQSVRPAHPVRSTRPGPCSQGVHGHGARRMRRRHQRCDP